MNIIADKTNNPLNIRFNAGNKWRGQIGEYKGFCIFSHESYGIRAAYKLLTNYIANGFNTIRQIVSRWAPPTENNTEKYISFVCYETFLEPDKVLSDCTIHDYWTKILILQAMAKMECGREYECQQINLYINYPEKYI